MGINVLLSIFVKTSHIKCDARYHITNITHARMQLFYTVYSIYKNCINLSYFLI